jgi:hypothetical protein
MVNEIAAIAAEASPVHQVGARDSAQQFVALLPAGAGAAALAEEPDALHVGQHAVIGSARIT